jgi:GDP-L-fucose synthase
MLDLSAARVLVTGGSGFLGRHIVARLEADACRDVVAPTHAEYDLTREDRVERLFAAVRPDVVIHAAGLVGGIGANRRHPGRFFYDNITMGVLTMEHARRAGVSKFVTIGTICAYPRDTRVPFREADLWNGYPEETNAPYGLAKKMLLVQGQAYRDQYGFNAIFLLPTNLDGPHDNVDPSTSHVIPALIRRVIGARDAGRDVVEVWGDGSATREFLFVEDAARAIVLAAERYEDGAPLNLGTGREISIRDLASAIARLTGYAGGFAWDASKPNGQPRRCVDVSRARDLIGFEATTPFEDGLARTVAWLESSYPWPAGRSRAPTEAGRP